MTEDYVMLKEILEQPEVVDKQIAFLLNRTVKPSDIVSKLLDKGKRDIYLIGCGTSNNAGLVAQYLMSKYCNVDVHTSISTEFFLNDKQVKRGGVVIAISQSGGTADTINAMKYARERNFDIISVVNTENSKMEQMSDLTILLHAGSEKAIASTKAYSVQVATAACIAYYIKCAQGNLPNWKEIYEDCCKVSKGLQTIVDNRSAIQKIAGKHAKSNGILFIGKGVDYVTCREARLKMCEVNYMMTSALPAEELRHGPIAMIDDTRSVIGIVSEKEHLEAVTYNLGLAKKQGAKTILITPYADADTKSCCDDLIKVPEIDPFFAPIASIIPIQLLVYYIGVELGHNIDSPRNLVKCVGDRK